MMSTSQSGVIACHSISTARTEANSQKTSALKAWPEITDWLTYHTLSTIGALYRPDFLPNLDEMALLGRMPPLEDWLGPVIRGFPAPEQFMSQVVSQVEQYMETVYEYYRLGIDFDKQALQRRLANAIGSLGELDASSKSDHDMVTFLLTKLASTLSSDDAYSFSHECGHIYSFKLIRPAITEFNATWSKIENLLQQAATGVYDSFWDKFNDLNSKLENCLSNLLALEELRANFFTVDGLPLEMQTPFIDRIYRKDSESGRNREREFFDRLLAVTGERPRTPSLLTMLAECLDPSNPVAQLELLQNFLQMENARTWTEEQWTSWFEQWYRLDTWETMMNANQNLIGKAYTALPKAMLAGRVDGMVVASCTEAMRLPVFYESIRQQLYFRKRVRTLTCPFKGRRRSCCGFGHYLRNIWAAIPDEERRRLRPPAKVCLQYASIDPL
jgi:hypothetical protein